MSSNSSSRPQSGGIQLHGANDFDTQLLVERLAREDFLGQLLNREGRARELALENGTAQLDWVDGIEKTLERPDLLISVEEEVLSPLRAGRRHLIWAGMGGSVQTVHALKRLGYVGDATASVHPLDSTDPAALNRTLIEIARLEGIGPDSAAGRSEFTEDVLRRVLERTLLVAVAMGMTSEEPITHLTWYWDLLIQFGIELPETHVRVIALEDSFLDRYAREHNVQSFPLSLEGECHTAGRMSSPTTRVFLWPVAWSLAAGKLDTKDGRSSTGELLRSVLLRAQELYGVNHRLSGSQRVDLALSDPFLKLAAFVANQEIRFNRNKVLLDLPEEWEGLAPWIEQIVEESLGKQGKGFLVFYDQDFSALVSTSKDSVLLRVRREDQLLSTSVSQTASLTVPSAIPVVTLTVPISPIHQLPTGLAEVASLFAGFEKTVAAFGYLQGIVFAGQPAVEAYKRYARELRESSEAVLRPASSTRWVATFGAVTIDYSALMTTGLLTAEELKAEVAPDSLKDAAPLLAAILLLARRKGWLGYLDLTYNGEQPSQISSVLNRIRKELANSILRIPAKVRSGPRDYHSTEQSEVDGPPEVTSIRFVSLQHEQVLAGSYSDRFLMAQALGTWQAMEDASRWILMVVLTETEAGSVDLQALFTKVNSILVRNQ